MGIQTKSTKKGTCKYCIQEGKERFQKKVTPILVDKHIQQQQQHKKKEKEGFTIVSLDESFFFYDSLVRRIWIEENKDR